MSIKNDDEFIAEVKRVNSSYASSGITKECAHTLLRMLDASRESLSHLKNLMREEKWLRRSEDNRNCVIQAYINEGLRDDISFGRVPWRIGEVKDGEVKE
jgi:hypothetical protein